uniref:T6SS Phospholipase effector Tle1-like catalytic domain-containing protein n=1 Tax=Gibberella zeae TaxID=5518 RepID=A0A4E9EEZ3_GIBZA
MPSANSFHVVEAIAPDEYVKLILCFDGTGNTFSGTNADTNVVKILRKLDRNNKNQFHYYQTGIGTYDVDEKSVHKSTLGEIKSKVSKTIDQGFGTTFDSHIMAGYRFLMRYYEPHAKIYIFGFSRGAYTAKYLSRMVNKVGLLCKGNEEMVPFAYRLYARSLQCESDDRIAAKKSRNGWLMVDAPEQLPVTNEATPLLDDNNQPNGAPNGYTNGNTNGHTNGATNGDKGYSQCTCDKEDEHAHVDEDEDEDEDSDTDDEEDKSTFMAGNVNIKRRLKTKIARREVKAFGRTFCRNEGTDPKKHVNIKVHFLGMWDCVNSVAVVENSAPAPVEITGTAKHVRHAVAVDERRVKFKPALLAQDIRTVVKETVEAKEAARQKKELLRLGKCCKCKLPKRDKRTPAQIKEDAEKQEIEDAKEAAEKAEDIREVWFPGNHGDIGGGWPAMPELVEPDKMPWYKKLACVFKSMKPNDVTGDLKSDDLQMSDMALDWMIREVTLVGKKDEKSAVHWCHTVKRFRKNMDNTEIPEGQTKTKLQRYVIEGFKHDTLSFGYGSSFFKVLMWNLMEHIPGIPRWELNGKYDDTDTDKDKAKAKALEAENGWESWRWTPNLGSFRDIPRRAVLHNSLIERLKAKDAKYYPENDHGDGKPCLLGPGKKGVARIKEAEKQNQKALEDYETDEERTWAARHQLWQLDPPEDKAKAKANTRA